MDRMVTAIIKWRWGDEYLLGGGSKVTRLVGKGRRMGRV